MGVVITATGVSHGADTAGIIVNSARAARAALTAADAPPDSVGVLINTGIYRDSNMVEPAMSALIQKEAGIGLEYGEHDPRSFSFDLMNGACGVLNAVQVASALLGTGSTGRVLVVAGDTHPSLAGPDAPADFPYATAGAALLLELAEGPDGFGSVHVELADGPAAVEGFVDTATMGTTGRSAMTVRRSDDFERRLLDVAVAAGSRALTGDADPDTTVLIASRPTPGFRAELSAKLGIRVLDDGTGDHVTGDTHTATLPLAYHHAAASGRLDGVRHVLMVAAGAGPSAAAALYRIPGW
ncbi:3-oxoacyl-[acyl-carrier-protein] synthase III C-terminal domain-containing protein [Rhodococcus sp. NPDC003322]